jgi:hypothetical protein
LWDVLNPLSVQAHIFGGYDGRETSPNRKSGQAVLVAITISVRVHTQCHEEKYERKKSDEEL